ncbi:MAG: AAA family ATPase [Nitrospiraceae bacterium]|nr:MAG: AAA family ATPase [Nitrospiraceae bacterium]
MYEQHFSFRCKPFELLPNPDFLFQSSTHKKAITYLEYGIKEKVGFILITGEIGSGKTTIIRNFIKNLSSSVKLSRINNTKVSSQQLISMINEDFGLDVEGKSKTKLLSELNDFLIDQYAKKTQPILLIDEAQNLSPNLLEEIRLLSNLETDRAKLLQIILVGQPELNKTLMLQEMMQLRQRININYHISPLTIDETIKYITHRLTIAGNTSVIRFQGDMSELIYRFSRGIPRLINILCDFALLATFVEGKKEVSTDIVREVIKDLESRIYSHISEDNLSAEKSKDGEHEYRALTGDIAIRIIELEETVKKSIVELTALSERFTQLESEVSEIKNIDSDNQLNALSERVTSLEKKTTSSEENTPDNHDAVSDRSLAEQAESLKNILSNVNNKLKKI